MFHRVKSETQTTTPIQDNDDRPAVIKVAQSAGNNETPKAPQPEVRERSQSVEIETADKAVINKVTTETTTTKKEEQTMNQPTDNTAPETQQERIPAETGTASYQRAGTAPVSNVGGGYPGAYPGYASATPNNTASSGDRRLTIGAGITMSGEIESCDYLLVEGTVEAALKGASVLDIAESGVFYGTVEIEDATIAGRFEGDITAHGRLTLREGATVTGSISYKELEIESGAIIDGKLTPLQAVQATKKPSAEKKEAAPAPAKAKSAAPAAKAETSTPANNDGELFTKAATAAE